ncbi:hypothetical protein R69776_01051 [Paraburkholderia nemoris]|uniref:Uncharacterized protein n=1 Tax=Paraburkholderia nemoris TaxID=2793076 RepID=A0ABN7KW33_9BURK|nr:hypothetical protein R69776_01051 [Paraburkholderia nemoris]CAE6715029.1 hypothetical protein LMG22931_01467 [Paraburkholderia nemoris]
MGPQPGSGAGHIANPGGGVEGPNQRPLCSNASANRRRVRVVRCRTTRPVPPGYAHSSAIAAFV